MSRAQAPNTWKDVFINVDLHVSASVYLDKLDSWKEFAKSAATGQKLSRLVYRYEHCWLPLHASWNPNHEVEPPNDVQWIWHLHQLRTDSYCSYCVERFGRVLPHRLRTLRPAQLATAVQQTAGAWRQRYPGEPFDLPTGAVWMTAADDSTERTANSLVDLLTDVARLEVDFTYQVSLPHMRDANFLYHAVERYRKLLFVRRLRASEFSTTALPVDILLMIRVHALHPTQFNGDMRRLFGDSTAALAIDWASLEYDAPPSTVVYQSDNIWQQQFGHGEALFIDGSGLRGRRVGAVNCGGDETAMRQLPRELVSHAGVDSCDVTFTSVTVDEVWSRAGMKRIGVEARLLGENSFAREILFRASGSIGAPIFGGKHRAVLGSAHFSVTHNRGIELAVFGRRGALCFARQRSLTTKTFSPMQHCAVNGISSPIATVILPKITYTDPKITVTFNVQVSWIRRLSPFSQQLAKKLYRWVTPIGLFVQEGGTFVDKLGAYRIMVLNFNKVKIN